MPCRITWIRLSGTALCRLLFSASDGRLPNSGGAADRVADRAGAFDKAARRRAKPRPSGCRSIFPVWRPARPAPAVSVAFVVEGSEIDRHGANVLVGQGRELLHHRRHRSGGDAVEAGFAGSQIGVKLVFAPGDRRMRQRGQRRRLPAFGKAAGEIGAGLLRAERIARRMAGAAMAEALDQIGAAIPCRRISSRRLRTSLG